MQVTRTQRVKDVECFRWKGHGTGWEGGRNKSKHHPGLSSYMWGWPSTAHVSCYISMLDLSWGFFILPLIFSAGAVLLASSTFQAGNYLCSTADLNDLSRANGGINFHPWIREYEASGFEPILCKDIQKWVLSFAQSLERLFCSEVLRPEVSNYSVPTMLALKEKVTLRSRLRVTPKTCYQKHISVYMTQRDES